MDANENTCAFFSIKEFAAKLGVHESTIRRSIKSGRISTVRIGVGKKANYRIPYSEINRIALFDLEDMVEKIIQQRMKRE